MPNRDIRWIQRFSNYRKAIADLQEAVELYNERELTNLEQKGLIQTFEFTFDLGWKTLQDLIVELGYSGERNKPNLIIAEAAKKGYVNEKAWKQMTHSRNWTSHTYNAQTADEIAESVIENFYDLFPQLETRLQLEKLNREQQG